MNRFIMGEYLAPPTFDQWRTTTDAVMIPDPSFVKQLRALDPELYVQWDWGGKRWEIWRKPKGEPPMHMMTVQNRDRTYRELGADILLKLQAGDPHRYGLKQMVEYFNTMDDAIHKAKRRKIENRISAITQEAQWYMAGLRVQVPKRFEDVGLSLNITPEPKVHYLEKKPNTVIGRMVKNA